MTSSAVPFGHQAGEPIAAGQAQPHALREVTPTVAQLFDLSDRVALVTGAGSGLGAVFAEALAEAGASVVCVGRRLERVQETAHRLEGIGCQSLPISADVTDEATVAAMFYEQLGAGKFDSFEPYISGYKAKYDLYGRVGKRSFNTTFQALGEGSAGNQGITVP